MRRQRGKAGHWTVLALVAGLLAGPTGVAGVLHPSDDPECRLAPGLDTAEATWSAASPDAPHCPTCHLLRGVRWSLSASPAPVAPPISAPSVPPSSAPCAAMRAGLSCTGRSPPSLNG